MYDNNDHRLPSVSLCILSFYVLIGTIRYTGTKGYQSNFNAHVSWQPPCSTQTEIGISSFLSVLRATAIKSTEVQQTQMLGHFRRLLHFPPAVHALKKLFDRRILCGDERAALSTGLYTLFRALAPVEEITNNKVFEQCSRYGIGMLMEKAKQLDTVSENALFHQSVSLECPLGMKRLVSPVRLNGVTYSALELKKHLKGGARFSSGSKFQDINKQDIVEDRTVNLLLLAHPHSSEALVYNDTLTAETIRSACFALGYGQHSTDRRRRNGQETKTMSDGIKCGQCRDPLNTCDFPLNGECGHRFHNKCSSVWIQTHNTCPVCVLPFVFKSKPRVTTLQEDLQASAHSLIAGGGGGMDDEDDEDESNTCTVTTEVALAALHYMPSAVGHILSILPHSLVQRFLEKDPPIDLFLQLVHQSSSSIDGHLHGFDTLTRRGIDGVQTDDWDLVKETTKRVAFLCIIRPGALDNASDGSLTINMQGHLCTLERHAGGSGGSTKLLDSLTGRATTLNRVALERKVNQMMETGTISVAMSEAFSSRLCEEAIMICMDISQSMQSPGFEDPEKVEPNQLPPCHEAWDSDDEFGLQMKDEEEEQQDLDAQAKENEAKKEAFVFNAPLSSASSQDFTFGTTPSSSISSSSLGETKSNDASVETITGDGIDGIDTSQEFFGIFNESSTGITAAPLSDEDLNKMYRDAIQLQEAFGLEKWLAMSKFSIVVANSNDVQIREDSLLRLGQCTFNFITHKQQRAYGSAYDVRRCNVMSVRELKTYVRRHCGKQLLVGVTEKNELVAMAKKSVMSMKPLTKHQKQVIDAVYEELNKFMYPPQLLTTMSTKEQNKQESKKQFQLARLALLRNKPQMASNHIARAKDAEKSSQFIPKLKMHTQMLTKTMGVAKRKVLRKQALTRLLLSVRGLFMFDDLCQAYRIAIPKGNNGTLSTREKSTLARINEAFELEITALLVDEDFIKLVAPETDEVIQLGDADICISFNQPSFNSMGTRKIHTLKVGKKVTFAEIVSVLQHATLVPKENIRLIQRGINLLPAQTIEECKVRDGDSISIITHSRSLSSKTRFCQKPRSEDQRVSSLKSVRKLLKRTGSTALFELLEHGGNVFGEISSLDDVNVGKGAPRDFLCPILHSLISDPVQAADGHTYERDAITRWFRSNSTSPMTGGRIENKTLTPNYNLRSQISEWLQNHPSGNDIEGSHSSDDQDVNDDDDDNDDNDEYKIDPIVETELENHPEFMQIFVRAPVTGGGLKTLNVLSSSSLAQIVELLLRKIGIACPKDMCVVLRSGTKSWLTVGDDGLRTLKALHIGKESTLSAKFIKTSGAMHSEDENTPLQSMVLENRGELLATFLRSNLTMYQIKLRYWLTKGGENRKYWKTYVPSAFKLWTDFHDIEDGWHSGSTPQLDATIENWAHIFNKESERNQLQFHSRRALKDQGRLSRMSTAKQLFAAFIDRTRAYDLPNSLGLITYGSECKIRVQLTPILEDFTTAMENARPNGETKMFDAIDLAAKKLIAYRDQHKLRHPSTPLPRLRILCFTDGKDTKSVSKPHLVAKYLQEHNIVLDAVNVNDSVQQHGGIHSNKLHQMAKSTRGYSFVPITLTGALKLNELELFLSCEYRSSLVQPVASSVTSASKLRAFGYESLDVCDEHSFPERVQNPQLSNTVTTLDSFLETGANEATTGASTATTTTTTSTSTSTSTTSNTTVVARKRTKRLMKELHMLKRKPHAMIRIYPSEDDITFWRVLIKGPPSTPYNNGIWLLTIAFPPTFPRLPPAVRFVTKILHCNINSYGRVCHSILDRNWSSETRVKTVLDCVFGLLLAPDVDSPLDSTLALARADDSGSYEGKIIAHTAAYARSGTLDSWEEELLR
jgi:ubiquitin-protein ligase